MKLNSLGRKTDLIFARFSGEVIFKENYILIKTPSNPGYHWGNYIIFDRAPKKGDLKEWKKLFDQEYSYYKEPHHYSFTWDTDKAEEDSGDYAEFIEEGFEFDSGVVLSTKKLVTPKFYNNELEIKIIETKEQWSDVYNLQLLCADPKYLNDYYEVFKREQMANYQRMAKANLGNWYGAYLNGKLVGDLGVFSDGEVARYQSVGTHPEFRRKGICATLVYEAGKSTLENSKIEYLVMEADPEYHAARIYESVGFNKSEVNHALSWWK
jgi:ribosomal protein S18 acetylase RimI-like enzyme